MSDRITLTDDDKADQSAVMEALRDKLVAMGFSIAPNNLTGPENLCRWYAYRTAEGAHDCECNEKPPSLIVTPHLYTLRDRQYASSEVAITGQHGEWFQIKAYSVSPEELPAALPAIEAMLVRAWNAIAKGATHD